MIPAVSVNITKLQAVEDNISYFVRARYISRLNVLNTVIDPLTQHGFSDY